MDHKYFQSRLSAFADGELPADEQAPVAEHVEQCHDCRRRLDKLRRLEELTESESDLADTDYWETAAQRIEAKLDRSITPVTDLSEVHQKSRSSFWWKLPAIAASVVVVGYIGLHQSDILKDDIMVQPSESPRPTLLVPEKPDTVQDEKKAASPKEAMSLTLPDDNLGAVVGEVERQEMLVNDLELGADESDAGSVRDHPSAGPSDETLRSTADLVKPELSEFVEEVVGEVAEEAVATPAPARSKTRSKVSASAGRDTDVVDRYVTQADKKGADYRDSQEPIMNKEVLAPSPVATDSVDWADNVSFEDVESQAALDQVFALDDWRHQRDSLVTLIAELEAKVTPKKKRRRVTQGFTAAAPENRGQEAEVMVVRTDLMLARTDLVEVWCRICQASDDETEISEGIEFLRRIASDGQSISGMEAAACLESIDHQ